MAGVKMEIKYSNHWIKKQKSKKKDITTDIVEFAIKNSKYIKDKYWSDAFNALCKIPPSGRTLKIVYRKLNQK